MPPRPSQDKKYRALNSYAIYSSMGIEMGVIIVLGVFGGIKADEALSTSPIFTIILSLAGVAIALYVMIKTVLKPKKSNKNESTDTH